MSGVRRAYRAQLTLPILMLDTGRNHDGCAEGGNGWGFLEHGALTHSRLALTGGCAERYGVGTLCHWQRQTTAGAAEENIVITTQNGDGDIMANFISIRFSAIWSALVLMPPPL